MAFTDQKLKYTIEAENRTKAAFDSVYGDINKLGGGFTATFGGAIPMAGAAATAIAGIGIAAIGVGRQLYDITKTASEFGSKIYDASQKTGLSAEALSSLQAAAETSGSSLEVVTKGVAKFAKEYEGTGKDIADELGKAMAAVAAAKPGFEQLTLAQKYFGKAGADLIPVIRSFDGDLPGLIKHMKDLGVTIDDDAASAADAFGDQMDLLGMQIAGVGRSIGTELMPEFTRMASDISGWIVQNKSEISSFATVTGTLFSNLMGGLRAVKDWVVQNGDTITTILKVIAPGQYYGLSAFWDQVTKPKAPGVMEGAGMGRAFGDDADTKETKRNNAARDAARAQAEAYRKLAAARKEFSDIEATSEQQTYDRSQRLAEKALAGYAKANEIEDYYQTATAAARQHFDYVRQRAEADYKRDGAGLTGELLAPKTARRNAAIAAANAEESDALEAIDERVAAKRKDIADKEAENTRQRSQDDLAMANAVAETKIALLDSFHQQGLLRETEYAIAVGQIRLKMLEAERAITDDAVKRAQIDEQIKRQKIANATEYRQAALKELDITRQLAEAEWDRAWAIAAQSKALQEMNDRMAETNPVMQAGVEIGGMFDSAIQQWTQGVGAMVEAWVLYGDVGPDALRKMTAQVLASVAAEAAAKALLYTAEGIAMLFFNPGAATNFFIAAGIMAGIAGSFAVAGRAVAGDSFKNDRSGSASATSSGRSSGTATASQTPYTRASERAYYSGQATAQIRLAVAIERFNDKVDTAKPGDVFIRGMKANRGAVGEQVAKDIRSNSATGTRIGRAIGIR